MTKTTVNKGGPNGQYRTTVPKGLGDAFDLDGKRLEWSVESGSRLTVEIVDEDAGSTS